MKRIKWYDLLGLGVALMVISASVYGLGKRVHNLIHNHDKGIVVMFEMKGE